MTSKFQLLKYECEYDWLIHVKTNQKVTRVWLLSASNWTSNHQKFQNMGTEESSWESKSIFYLSNTKLVLIDMPQFILFICQYFSIFQTARGAPGERTFLKNKWILMLIELLFSNNRYVNSLAPCPQGW